MPNDFIIGLLLNYFMAEKEIYVKITKNGPYLVYGMPTISQKIILSNKDKVCIKYGLGKIFEINSEPVALCRCGKSKNAPFCDNSHINSNFDGTETASFEPILKNAVIYKGPELTLADNETYCAFARFCDAEGSIWNLIYNKDEQSKQKAIEEANLCPSGRLLIYDNNGNLIEEKITPGIDVLEDEGLKISGPLWLKGNIRVESESGQSYEIRNKQTLCRCGKSKNKPFCDSTHRHIQFKT